MPDEGRGDEHRRLCARADRPDGCWLGWPPPALATWSSRERQRRGPGARERLPRSSRRRNGADPSALRGVKGSSFPVPRAKGGPSRFGRREPRRAQPVDEEPSPGLGRISRRRPPLAVASRRRGEGRTIATFLADGSRECTTRARLPLSRERERAGNGRALRPTERERVPACLPACLVPARSGAALECGGEERQGRERGQGSPRATDVGRLQRTMLDEVGRRGVVLKRRLDLREGRKGERGRGRRSREASKGGAGGRRGRAGGTCWAAVGEGAPSDMGFLVSPADEPPNRP